MYLLCAIEVDVSHAAFVYGQLAVNTTTALSTKAPDGIIA